MVFENDKTIWTIGHSNRAQDEFLKILQTHEINTLVDVRTFPGSNKYPHFNKEVLETDLPLAGIAYFHFPALGGRRKPQPDSQNVAWRNASFRGYADHMLSDEFQAAVAALEELANGRRLAYMCSEVLWWRCHRALISDYLKNKGWRVIHINDIKKTQEHPYTSAARAEQGNLFYN
jgi:uncharacterized protein (DUF488 family)